MPKIQLMFDGVEALASDISDGDFSRIIAWAVADNAMSVVVTPAVEEVRDEKSNIVTRSATAVMRDPTPNEAISTAFSKKFREMKNSTVSWEQSAAAEKAVQAAIDAVKPIG